MSNLTDRAELKPSVKAARQALTEDAGCTAGRAGALVEAVARAAVEEALAVVAGDEQVTGSVVEARLTRLRRILDALGKSAAPLSRYEAGAIFRIPPTQAGTLLRTYQARYSKDFRERMTAAVKASANAAKKKGIGAKARYEFQFSNAATLEYAVDRLRRHGYERTLSVDREELVLRIDPAVKVGQQDAKQFLKS